MHELIAAAVLIDIGHSLREAFFMLWETLWALILGFTLSGVVQAFVAKDQLQARLGSRRPGAIARATGYGMVSSSCSYAASAMAKSLFAKGAEFITAMVFMVASTNLVVELGIVLLVLMGWQFAAAEFVGGPIMIILLAVCGGLILSRPLIENARARLARIATEERTHVSRERQKELEASSLRTKVKEPAAWADASSYAVADVTMLRNELLIGYVVAGFLAILVPHHVWSSLFVQGHGFWTTLENALVGPLIAVISWVCSIGNVPLAAALWSGGISFGGVIAFVFADLIAMPLILIYAKFYGWRLTLRLVLLFYIVMVCAGLLTQLLFHATGLIPRHRSVSVASAHFAWNYTTYLNVIFLFLAAGVWWLAKNQTRFGGGTSTAIDPVCGMQVRIVDAPAQTDFLGRTYYFCADRCYERFIKQPEHFLESGTSIDSMSSQQETVTCSSRNVSNATLSIDPICGMSVDLATAPATRDYGDVTYGFCSLSCAERFDADPDAALRH